MDERTLADARMKAAAGSTAITPSTGTGGRSSGTENTGNTVTPRPTMTPRPTPTPTNIPMAGTVIDAVSDYQADSLEILNVPGEIIDAVESVEEFRNTVYNFLYDNGISVSVATVGSYYEKYGDGIYDFTLEASGEVIYGRYDRENNEYYYSFEEFN